MDTSRSKEEQIFTLTREVESMKADCKNMTNIEQNLRSEVNILIERQKHDFKT